MWRRVWPSSLSSMFEINPILYFFAIFWRTGLVSLNGGQRCTESGRNPEREGSSGQPSRFEISTAVRRRTSA